MPSSSRNSKLRVIGHWPAILFFAALLVALYFLSTHFYDPCAHKFTRGQTAIWSGDEPHYLLTISSLFRDGDLSLANNYESARLGGTDAGETFRGTNLDHHTLIRDERTRKSLLWTQVFAPGTPVECDPHDPLCVGYQRIGPDFADFTRTSLQYKELPQHPIPFAALIAILLKISRTGVDQVESRALLINVFMCWLAGVITYFCSLRSGLGPKWSLVVVSIVFLASPWTLYAHSLFPATFMGLMLVVALWAFLSKRYVTAAVFVAIACMQSEAFAPIFPAWALLLYLSRKKRAAWRFGLAAIGSLTLTSLISYVVIGKPTLRHMWFVFDIAPWRPFFEKPRGLLLFVPWVFAVFVFFMISLWFRKQDLSAVLRVIAAGIVPVAAVYMILPNTGGYCYGPRYWVPYMPWFALALVIGFKNYPRARSTAIAPILIMLVVFSALTTITSAIMWPSIVSFWSEPPWYASKVLWHAYHQTDVDETCPRGDLQFWLGSGCNNADRKSATVTLPTPIKSSSLAVVSRLACSAPIPDGTEVLQLRLASSDGSVQTRTIIAGRDSSEWAYDCARVKPTMQHKRATIFVDYSSKLPDGPCEGHFYFTKLALDGVKDIKSIELEWVGGPGGILLDKLGLIDEKHRSLYPVESTLFPR